MANLAEFLVGFWPETNKGDPWRRTATDAAFPYVSMAR